MFTPQEVSEKTFPKESGFNNGYGMAAVDEFLDVLTEDYTALYKDNAALKAKLKVLVEKVEEDLIWLKLVHQMFLKLMKP